MYDKRNYTSKQQSSQENSTVRFLWFFCDDSICRKAQPPQTATTTLCRYPISFLLPPSWLWRDKEGFAWIASNLWSNCSMNLTSQSCFSLVFRVWASGCWKTDVHNQARWNKHQLLSLGSELYSSNIKHMLTKGLSGFMQSLSQVHQNWAQKRKALLAWWVYWS